jgi:hypothetical protein
VGRVLFSARVGIRTGLSQGDRATRNVGGNLCDDVRKGIEAPTSGCESGVWSCIKRVLQTCVRSARKFAAIPSNKPGRRERLREQPCLGMNIEERSGLFYGSLLHCFITDALEIKWSKAKGAIEIQNTCRYK